MPLDSLAAISPPEGLQPLHAAGATPRAQHVTNWTNRISPTDVRPVTTT